jgi:hypothetical protein
MTMSEKQIETLKQLIAQCVATHTLSMEAEGKKNFTARPASYYDTENDAAAFWGSIAPELTSSSMSAKDASLLIEKLSDTHRTAGLRLEQAHVWVERGWLKIN